ncbi:MAG: extracellular solute-binding protein [Eubacteriales bacterium]
MNRRKKIAMCFLISIMLVGCTKQTQIEMDENTVNTDKIILKYVSWSDGRQREIEETIVETYNARNKEVEVQCEFISKDNYLGRLNVLISTNQSPDVGYLPEYCVNDWGENGRLLQLNDVGGVEGFSKYCFFGSEDSVWGIAPGLQVLLLYYNKDLFEKYDIETPPTNPLDPWSWEEFVDVALQLTRDINGKMPTDEGFLSEEIEHYGLVTPNDTMTLTTLLYSNGGSIASKDGLSLNLNGEESVEVLQAIYDLMYVYGVCEKEVEEENGLEWVYQLQNNEVAMAIAGQWRLSDFAVGGDFGYEVGVAALPAFEMPVNIIWGSPVVSFAQCKYPQEAKEFIEFYIGVNSFFENYYYASHMPNNLQWYTNPELLKLWADDENHSQEFREVIVPTVTEIIIQPEIVTLRNYGIVNQEIIVGELEKFWLNRSTLDEVLKGIEEKTQSLFEGVWEYD